MESKHILTEIREDGVATVTLNRAEVHNAFNDTVIADLTGVLRRLGDDDKVRRSCCERKERAFPPGPTWAGCSGWGTAMPRTWRTPALWRN